MPFFRCLIPSQIKKVNFVDKQHPAMKSSATSPVKPALTGTSGTRPPWKDKVNALENRPHSPPTAVDLTFTPNEVPSSSFSQYALIDSGSAVHTAPSSSFISDFVLSNNHLGATLTVANGSDITPTSTIS